MAEILRRSHRQIRQQHSGASLRSCQPGDPGRPSRGSRTSRQFPPRGPPRHPGRTRRATPFGGVPTARSVAMGWRAVLGRGMILTVGCDGDTSRGLTTAAVASASRVVATDVVGCADAIEDVTGLLVPPRDVGALVAALRRYV